MIIRRAELKDAERIHQLAKSLWIDWANPQKTGFLVNRYTTNQYQDRMNPPQMNPFFYVAEENSDLLGFLACLDSSTFKQLTRQGKLGSLEGDKRFMLNQEGNWIFGDQIGINPLLKRGKIGTEMMKQLFKDMDKKQINNMYVSILHKPVRNYTSIEFCKALGFKHIKGEDTQEGIDRISWGMYRLRL